MQADTAARGAEHLLQNRSRAALVAAGDRCQSSKAHCRSSAAVLTAARVPGRSDPADTPSPARIRFSPAEVVINIHAHCHLGSQCARRVIESRQCLWLEVTL